MMRIPNFRHEVEIHHVPRRCLRAISGVEDAVEIRKILDARDLITSELNDRGIGIRVVLIDEIGPYLDDLFRNVGVEGTEITILIETFLAE
jgi:hypothetical protein